MSDQHTPEPWLQEYDDNGFYEIKSALNSGRIVFTQREYDIDEANARRIVACVNACAGLGTAPLERLVAGGGKLVAADFVFDTLDRQLEREPVAYRKLLKFEDGTEEYKYMSFKLMKDAEPLYIAPPPSHGVQK